VAHAQGIEAGKSGMTPLDCPWPIWNYGTCQAWLAGYSVAVLATLTSQTRDANGSGSINDGCST